MGVKHKAVHEPPSMRMAMHQEQEPPTLRAILDHVFVRPSNQVHETTASGIVIPGASREPESKGLVVSVGPGRVNKKGILVPMTVQVGDVVHYNRHTGVPAEFNGELLLCMRDEDVLAIED
jgi:chaperonin GroES